MLFLLACAPDTDSKLAADSAGDSSNTATAGQIQVSFEAAFQQNGWGSGQGRCELKVSFTIPGEDDDMFGAPAQPWDPLNQPAMDGDCAVTIRDREEMAAILEEQGGLPDNWVLHGSVDMGASISLENETMQRTLLPATDQTGRLWYGMQDCNEETFPFGQSFDLKVPEGAAAYGVEGFEIAEAVAIGPPIHLESVGQTGGLEMGAVYQNADLPISWGYDGTLPDVSGGELSHSVRLTTRNNELGGISEFEGIICLSDPLDGTMSEQFSIPASDLAQLTPNPEPGGPFALSLQMDSITEGPAFTMPWGAQVRVFSVVSLDGTGELLAAP